MCFLHICLSSCTKQIISFTFRPFNAVFSLCHQLKSIYHECFGNIFLVYALILKKIVFLCELSASFFDCILSCNIPRCPCVDLPVQDLSKCFMDAWFHKTERSKKIISNLPSIFEELICKSCLFNDEINDFRNLMW